MTAATLWNRFLTHSGALKRCSPVIFAVVAILAFGLGGEEWRLWGRLEREGLAGGELWRLITAHAVHLGWGHLWLNLIALIVMAALFSDLMAAGDWVLAGLLGAAGIDLGLLLLHGDVQWYLGLSGVLHGLMVVGSVAMLRAGSPMGYLLVAGLTGKLIWEQLAGPLPFSESASGGPVLVDAHLYGAVGGIIALLLRSAVARLP